MNKQQEALRLALEALEVLGWQPTEEAMDYRDNAIDAIREALAEQPAQEPVCAHGVEKNECDFCQQPAQPSKPLTLDQLIEKALESFWAPQLNLDLDTLFQLPDRLASAMREEESQMVKFARAIEAAHGIKVGA